MRLCGTCNAANGAAFEEGECRVCGGKAAGAERMAEKAAALLRDESARTFSISTKIPKDWLAREERAWDERLSGAESVKNMLNRSISAALGKASGAEYVAEGECRIVFDFSNDDVSLERAPLFLFGRYMKRSAGLSQSRWRCLRCNGKGCPHCGGKGKHYESVEERIGEPLKKAADAGGYVLHASGREDVDATNSAGRPFVMEITNPKNRTLDLAAVAAAVGEGGEVSVRDLRVVNRGFVELVTESHFDKAYEAEVEFGRDVSTEELASLRSLEGKTLLQKTPKRVVHRRADIVRHRKIKHVEAVRKDGQTPRQATLIIKAEAGTYIKELISGDDGRTEPSVSALLGTPAKCTKLDVMSIDDGFLDFCLERIG